MLAKKKQCLLTTFLPGSDSTPATPSCDASDFDETVEMSESSDCEHASIYERKFLLRWKLLFPWITQSEEEMILPLENRDQQKAGRKNTYKDMLYLKSILDMLHQLLLLLGVLLGCSSLLNQHQLQNWKLRNC